MINNRYFIRSSFKVAIFSRSQARAGRRVRQARGAAAEQVDDLTVKIRERRRLKMARRGRVKMSRPLWEKETALTRGHRQSSIADPAICRLLAGTSPIRILLGGGGAAIRLLRARHFRSTGNRHGNKRERKRRDQNQARKGRQHGRICLESGALSSVPWRTAFGAAEKRSGA